MKLSDATLGQRAGYLYRHLLLLRQLFQGADDSEGAESLEGHGSEALALRAGIREMLDELTEQARVFTAVPFPLRDWRPGEGSDDERWRALTEIERREVLSLVSGYENLIAWVESQTYPRLEQGEPGEVKGSESASMRKMPKNASEAAEYLGAERARIARFRQEMSFLDRRRIAEVR